MGTFIVFLDAGYAFTKITSMGEGHSLLEQPAERGEALTVTDFQAVCHRSLLLVRDALAGWYALSGNRRMSGVPTVALAGWKAGTDQGTAVTDRGRGNSRRVPPARARKGRSERRWSARACHPA